MAAAAEGKAAASGETGTSGKILRRLTATLHLLTSLPEEMMADKEREFEIEVRGSLHPTNRSPENSIPFIIAKFNPRMVTYENDRIEQKFTKSSAEWVVDEVKPQARESTSSAAPDYQNLVKVSMGVRESYPGEKTPRVLATASFYINVNDVMQRKVITKMVGLSIGQCGMSFCVSENDLVGFRHRLTSFLEKYNPSGLALVDSVLNSKVTEVEAFTTVWKKYNMIDYKKRARSFFMVYGPEQVDNVDTVLKEWEKREEELMRSLVLENGPEPNDIDLKKRLIAFTEKYRIVDMNIDEMVKKHKKDSQSFFEKLVKDHGPEPHPSTYLFPAVKYEGKKRSATAEDAAPKAPAVQEEPQQKNKESQDAQPQRKPPTPVEQKPAVEETRPQQPVAQSQQRPTRETPTPTTRPTTTPPDTAEGTRQSPSLQPTSSGAQQGPPPQQAREEKAAVTPPQQAIEAPQASRQERVYEPQHQQQVQQRASYRTWEEPPTAEGTYPATTEQQGARNSVQPVQSNVPPPREDPTQRNNAYKVASVRGDEGMQRQPISTPMVATQPPQQQQDQNNYSPQNPETSWTKLTNDLRELSMGEEDVFLLSEPSFIALMHELRYTESMIAHLLPVWRWRSQNALKISFLAPSEKEFETVRHETISLTGLHPISVQISSIVALRNKEHEACFTSRLLSFPSSARQTTRVLHSGEYETLVNAATHGLSPDPSVAAKEGIRFAKKPLKDLPRSQAVTIMVCDLSLGTTLVDPSSSLSPSEKNKYDSVLERSNTEEEVVTVFSAAQCLPRYIVHCSVDPSVMPCQVHPNRQVEYYVVDGGAFACSQCIIRGPHQGKQVIGVDEATTQARGQMQEYAHQAEAVAMEIAQADREVDQELQAIQHSEIRQEAMRQAEEIRREAERRVQEILAEAEMIDKKQERGLLEERKRLQELQHIIRGTISSFHDSLRTSNPGQLLQALQRARTNDPAENVRQRLHSGGTASRSGSMGVSQQQNYYGNSTSRAAPSLPQGSTQRSGLPSSGAWGETKQSQQQSMPSQSDLYAKFMSLKRSSSESGLPRGVPNTSLSPAPKVSTLTQPQQTEFERGNNASSIANARTQQQRDEESLSEAAVKAARENMTKGWAAFRAGDKQHAEAIWREVYERNPHNAYGARARAYIFEAVERDYNDAALWYEKALRIDPNDCMTLFNYGVLLESVLGKRTEALALFDSAHKLGDHTAGRRAQMLRQQMMLEGRSA